MFFIYLLTLHLKSAGFAQTYFILLAIIAVIINHTFDGHQNKL
jgi:hypothetical protein